MTKVSKEVVATKQSIKRRKHNPLTRWTNSRKKGVLWSIRRETIKRRGQPKSVETVEYYVPHGLLYNPEITGGPEPFDTIKLAWKEELQHFVANKDAKLRVLPLTNGDYLYRVFKGGKSKDDPEEVLLEVISGSKLTLKKGRRKG